MDALQEIQRLRPRVQSREVAIFFDVQYRPAQAWFCAAKIKSRVAGPCLNRRSTVENREGIMEWTRWMVSGFRNPARDD